MISVKRFLRSAKNAILRSSPKTGPGTMRVEPKVEPENVGPPEPKFTIPVTVVIIWSGKILHGHADSVIATARDVLDGLADHLPRESPPPAFTIKFPEGGTTVVVTEQEGLTWARGHDDETEAALLAAFALWEQAPVVGFQGAHGVTGAQGPTGPQGATGVQGRPGLQGPTGVQGATGVTGTLPRAAGSAASAQSGGVGPPTVILMPSSGRPPP